MRKVQNIQTLLLTGILLLAKIFVLSIKPEHIQKFFSQTITPGMSAMCYPCSNGLSKLNYVHLTEIE